MDLCDENYHTLLRLAPAMREMGGQYISEAVSSVGLYLEILEQTPYTTLIHLTHYFPDERERKADPDVTLRLYHDLRQAEVLNLTQGVLPLDRRFESPALDWKWKNNLFMSKWLSFCVTHEHCFIPLGSGNLLHQSTLERA